MAFKTYAGLTATTTIADADLFAVFPDPTGPLKKITAVNTAAYFTGKAAGASGHFFGYLDVANTWSATQTLVGTSATPAQNLLNAVEPITISATAATGTIALYPSTQSILYYTTAASANWTVNLTFSAGTTYDAALSTGQSMTTVFMATQGASPKYNTAVQVDGTSVGVTTIWQAGAPVAGAASGVDIYSYVVIKTGAATFTVLASVVQFK